MSKHNRKQSRKIRQKVEREYSSARTMAKRAAKRAGGMVVLPPRDGKTSFGVLRRNTFNDALNKALQG